MTDDSTSDTISTGAMLVGGALIGYFGGRWLLEPVGTSSTAAPPTSSAPPTTAATAPRLLDVPVSSPDQVPTTAPPTQRPAPLPRTYDQTFERYRGDVPIEYLRALAYSESRMNPRTRARSGARGLMQITASVRASFNDAHHTHHEPDHLDNPEINIAIGCWALRFIASSYAKNHAPVPNMRADWSNPRFVELLTFGWNGGFSERRGVGRIVTYLERKGARDIDIDLVHGHAGVAGADEHIANPHKVSWCKGVTALYFRERSLSEPSATPVA